MSPLWRQDPGKLARPRAGQPRKIPRGPLIDLEALQEAIRDGTIHEDAVDVVNAKCDDDLDNLRWNLRDVLSCLLAARPEDYRDSQWCTTT